MTPYPDALAAIEAAQLTDKLHALAARLLARVHPDNGYISLSWDEAMAACGVASKGSVWKYLGRLKAAGIIHYDTNARVDVTFEAWRTSRQRPAHAPLADSTRAASGACIAADTAADTAADDATRRQRPVHAPLAARGRADSPHTPWLVGIDQDPILGDLDLKTNQPEPVETLTTDEQARNYALLTDPEVGVSEESAKRLATQHRFSWLLRQTFAHLEDRRAGKVSSSGALVHRLDKKFKPGDLTPKDRSTDLYRRHVSEEEDAEQEWKRYIPDEYAGIINT